MVMVSEDDYDNDDDDDDDYDDYDDDDNDDDDLGENYEDSHIQESAFKKTWVE